MLAFVAQHGLHIEQPLARIHHLLKLLARGIVGLAWRLAEYLGKPGDRVRVDDVIFG